jgi:hypothetical protein
MQLNLARLLALSVVFGSPVWAQDTDETATADGLDEFEPAVSTSDLTVPDDAADAQENAGAPAPILAQGVTRRQGTSGVMDRMDLDRTEITGNQELPKVLYIVPWQKSGPAELMGKPVNTLLDEVLAPIDRTEFVRQVDYYDDLYREEQE